MLFRSYHKQLTEDQRSFLFPFLLPSYIVPLLPSMDFKDFHPLLDGFSPSIPLQSLILPDLWIDEALFEVLVQSVLVSFPPATLCSVSIFQLGIHDLFW